MNLAIVLLFQNEERFLETALASIEGQTRRPDRLLLVDDGSSDGSSEIAASFAAAHDYARVLTRDAPPPRADRLDGGAAVIAFQAGVAQLDIDWDIVAKLDADIDLNPRTFRTMEHAFVDDPALGVAGPYLSTRDHDGRLVRQRGPEYHVEGPTTFYRRACFEQISPLPAMLGWDTIDELRARMRGWKTRSIAIPGGDPVHLRPMGEHSGYRRSYRRWGECAYRYGEHPLAVLLIGARRLGDDPPVVGGVNYVVGWMSAAARRVPRAEPELRAYVRRDQMRRIGRRLIGRRTSSDPAPSA